MVEFCTIVRTLREAKSVDFDVLRCVCILYILSVFNLFGDELVLRTLVEKYPNLSGHVKIYHAEEVVTNETKPSVAIRGMRRSSMRLAIESVV